MDAHYKNLKAHYFNGLAVACRCSAAELRLVRALQAEAQVRYRRPDDDGFRKRWPL